MFGLFKRTKIEVWEIDFLKVVFLKLSNQIGDEFYEQISLGLLRGVMIGVGDIPNYVGFTYHSSAYNKYYVATGKNYKISDIKVKDAYSGALLSVSVYIAYGMVNGYSIYNNYSKYKFDTLTVDVSLVKKIIIGEQNNSKILAVLTEAERKFINESDIYSTTINGKDYYHLKELEDGNFIGIDEAGNIYKILHSPLEISLIKRNELLKILQG